jgi:CheW-like domain
MAPIGEDFERESARRGNAPARGEARRFALLAVGGVEYALESSLVRRSLPAPDPLPAAVRHGDAVFAVVDLRRLCRVAAGREALIVLAEGGGARLALVADSLAGLEWLDPASAVALPALYGGPERRWIAGLLPQEGGHVVVLLRLEGLQGERRPAAGSAAC